MSGSISFESACSSISATDSRSAFTSSVISWRSPPSGEKKYRLASCSRVSIIKKGLSVFPGEPSRSEEHTSELQSQSNLVCRLLLEKKKKKKNEKKIHTI